MAELVEDIAKFVRYCERKGVKPAIRLNGTSDIQWEVAHPVEIVESNGDTYRFANVFELFPQVQFYDYTKIYKRAYRSLPSNYSLTLSYSEANSGYSDKIIATAKDTGLNIAVVYRTKELRDGLVASGGDHLQGAIRMTNRPVFNGDETDLRFTDPQGVIVGLYAKGPAKRDTSGFVVG
jgi:hypothetical protein